MSSQFQISKKLLLINVWATWCGPCKTEFPDLVTANRMYRRRNFEFISISIDSVEKREEVLRFLEKQQASNRNYIHGDENRDLLADKLDKKWSGALPLTILVEPGGKIRYRKEGRVDPLKLRRAIVAFLPRRTISAGSDIGLAHVLLGRERAALIDADLGHHSARRPAGPGRAEAREPPPVPVLEVVDVVRTHAVRT